MNLFSPVPHLLKDPAFATHPPVLVDVGASGGGPEMWTDLAPYSIYLGFDADTRETEFSESASSSYRRRIVFHRAVVGDEARSVRINLTKSPYCSSTLAPACSQLGGYAFRHLFKVEKLVEVPAIRLDAALTQVGLDGIDFLKIDSQGTDLRIFKSLPAAQADRVLAVEMEPGLISVYEGEDKVWHALAHMEQKGFWLAQFDVRHTPRASADWFDRQAWMVQRFPEHYLGRAPGWSNLLFLAEPRPCWTYREWLFAIILAEQFNHSGAALSLCDQAMELGLDGMIPDMRRRLWRLMRLRGVLRSLPRLPRAGLGLLRRKLFPRT